MTFVFAFSKLQYDEETSAPPVYTKHERAEITKTQSLGIFSPADIQQLFDAANVTIPFSLEYSVEVLSIEYYSVDKDDNLTKVSGAFLIPQGTTNLPLLSMQHGTETKADRVASVSPTNSTEGMVGLISASLGYFTLVPDYIGFGVSNMTHPYMHMASIVPSVIDFMKAGKDYASENQITLNGKVFLTGYSEGGFVTLGTQKAIEEQYANEFTLTAVAPCAGPYDLKGMTDTIFRANNYGNVAYIAYYFNAYNDIYGWNRLADIFQEPYNGTVPGLFDGSKTWGEIISQLSTSFSNLINPGFVTSYNNGNEPAVLAALEENTLLDWTPYAPIHFFHGDADEIVPYQNVLTAIEKFTSIGAQNMLLTTIPGGTHETAGPASIYGTIEWFESF
ncbi:MAG: lipase family protein [Bacteroidales bacterium]